MENNVYNFKINIDWGLIGVISQIDRFDATWSTIEKNERNQFLKADVK